MKNLDSTKYSCKHCDALAQWLYMPSSGDDNHKIEDDLYCDNCVSRGCSCNDESIHYDGRNEDLDELNNQANGLRDLINKNNYIMVNYGKVNHCSGKELETINDIKQIRLIVNNVTNEQLRHFSFSPLDSKGREYPCCEFDYEKDGFLKKDFEDNIEKEITNENI